MSDSILDGTKKALSLAPEYDAFDQELIMHINSVFSTLNQLGVGPAAGFEIADATATWATFLLGNARFNFVKSYVYISVRLVFDPPQTAHLISALKEIKTEYEYRIHILRESGAWAPNPTPQIVGTLIDGGTS